MPRTEEAFKQIRDERKEKILQAATQIFASKGLVGTKIADLATAAGISQGLLYRYYADKEEIFNELIQRATEGMNQLAQDSLKSQGTALDKLRWVTERFLQGMSKYPGYYRVLSQTFTDVETTHKDVNPMRQALRQIIVEGQANDQVIQRDPELLILLFLSCIQGLAANISNSNTLSSHLPEAEDIIRIFSNK